MMTEQYVVKFIVKNKSGYFETKTETVTVECFETEKSNHGTAEQFVKNKYPNLDKIVSVCYV